VIDEVPDTQYHITTSHFIVNARREASTLEGTLRPRISKKYYYLDKPFVLLSKKPTVRRFFSDRKTL
jgi:hypothetical protein